jgi:hypothetical protein
VLVIVAFLLTAFLWSLLHPCRGRRIQAVWLGRRVFIDSCSWHRVSYLGFCQGVDLADETGIPQRKVQLAIIGSIAITCVIYVALQTAFIGALPTEALTNGWAHIGTSFSADLSNIAAAFGPLAARAGVMGLTWLAVLL